MKIHAGSFGTSFVQFLLPKRNLLKFFMFLFCSYFEFVWYSDHQPVLIMLFACHDFLVDPLMATHGPRRIKHQVKSSIIFFVCVMFFIVVSELQMSLATVLLFFSLLWAKINLIYNNNSKKSFIYCNQTRY
jgi:hypothetical protein